MLQYHYASSPLQLPAHELVLLLIDSLAGDVSSERHPLLDSVIDLTLERHRDLLRRGAALVDEGDSGDQPRVLFYLEHAIQDAGITRS